MVNPNPLDFIEFIHRYDENALIAIYDEDGNELFTGAVKDTPYMIFVNADHVTRLEQNLDQITPYQWFLTISFDKENS